MTVLSDSSPLITLARIEHLDLLFQLYETITITPQVYEEVVVTGAGLAGATQISAAKWVHVEPLQKPDTLVVAQQRFGLGMGGIEHYSARQGIEGGCSAYRRYESSEIAQEEGLAVLGCVGVLYNGFGLKLVADLSAAYRQLLASGAYIDRVLLQNILKFLDLPPL